MVAYSRYLDALGRNAISILQLGKREYALGNGIFRHDGPCLRQLPLQIHRVIVSVKSSSDNKHE